MTPLCFSQDFNYIWESEISTKINIQMDRYIYIHLIHCVLSSSFQALTVTIRSAGGCAELAAFLSLGSDKHKHNWPEASESQPITEEEAQSFQAAEGGQP